MKVILIDYAEKYYPVRTITAVPEKRSGKFVQIRSNEAEYLVFSPREFTPYHAGLVEEFCKDKGLRGAYASDNRRFDIHEREWIVVGGGKFEIDDREKHIRLHDNSMAYGRFDSKGLREKIRSIDRTSDYTVQIE